MKNQAVKDLDIYY